MLTACYHGRETAMRACLSKYPLLDVNLAETYLEIEWKRYRKPSTGTANSYYAQFTNRHWSKQTASLNQKGNLIKSELADLLSSDYQSSTFSPRLDCFCKNENRIRKTPHVSVIIFGKKQIRTKWNNEPMNLAKSHVCPTKDKIKWHARHIWKN